MKSWEPQRGPLMPEWAMDIDETDRSIIAILEQDGRRAVTAIAKEVGVSEGTARARIASLQNRRMIRVVALCSPVAIGHEGIRLLISVRKLSIRAVALSLADLPLTNHVALVSGTHDIYVEAACQDMNQCVEFLDVVRRIPGVDRIEQQLVRRMYKNSLPAPRGVENF